MHIASLPGKFGIGTFGKEAYEYTDFLVEAGLSCWQILPLGQTTYGDSPYQSFSAFAGNPYFIDFDLLEEDGLLKSEEYINESYGDDDESIDYGVLFDSKYKILQKAYKNFVDIKSEIHSQKFHDFSLENKWWLEDYALFMALKGYFNLSSWQSWPQDIKCREKASIEKYKILLKYDIEYWMFIQYLFFKQWSALKEYANSKGIKFIGDIPIYVAEDSSDVWSNQKEYLIDETTSKPIAVAGCPPDIFSTLGQLWGNPLYDWEVMKSDNYKWWVNRVRESLKLYDIVRIDHFRGFESYWQIPYGDVTAVNGKWVKGPGMSLFNEIKKELGNIDVIAEDLGFLTNEVEEFLEESGFPGMKVLQFAFDRNNESKYLPHNHHSNCVVYTGTHDNDTLRGWFELTGPKDDVEYCKEYLALSEEEGYNWGFIRGAFGSVAKLAITTMQDFLELGNETRINLPSTLGENWKWRAKEGSYGKTLAEKIYKYTKMYGRN